MIARRIAAQLERASWIRRMFEEGRRLQQERGEANVFDFTLGNPTEEPPAPVRAALRRVAAATFPGGHGYMPNAGYPEVREVVARQMSRRTGLPYTARHILMTVGSAGALNTVLKALLDPGDEVLVPVPCFSEYRFYVENHGARMVPVETDASFQLDLDRLAGAITPRTRALLLNSPHNPTGVVYPARSLAQLETLLARRDPPITVICDEPYRELVYDGATVPEAPAILTRAVVAGSWSKSFALAGERIGFLALSPRIPEAAALAEACTFTQRTLGYVNAPALWQRVIAEVAGVPAETAHYGERRRILCDGLREIGYELTPPQGAFYVFPKTPLADDVAFVRILQQEGILAVPGSGFGRGGYLRLSLTAPAETIRRALPGFRRAFHRARGS